MAEKRTEEEYLVMRIVLNFSEGKCSKRKLNIGNKWRVNLMSVVIE